MQRRKLIGEILVEHGWVTPADVDEALRVQAELAARGEAGTKPLGAILVEMGKVTDDQVQQALEEQGRAAYQERGESETAQPEGRPAQAPGAAVTSEQGETTMAGHESIEAMTTRRFDEVERPPAEEVAAGRERMAELYASRYATQGQRIPKLSFPSLPTLLAAAATIGIVFYLRNRRGRKRLLSRG